MKRIILILALIIFKSAFSQNNNPKRELISMDDISIAYRSPRLLIEIKTTKPLQFKIIKNNKIILSGSNGMGEESFSVMRGNRYKLILFCGGDIKTKYFRI